MTSQGTSFYYNREYGTPTRRHYPSLAWQGRLDEFHGTSRRHSFSVPAEERLVAGFSRSMPSWNQTDYMTRWGGPGYEYKDREERNIGPFSSLMNPRFQSLKLDRVVGAHDIPRRYVPSDLVRMDVRPHSARQGNTI